MSFDFQTMIVEVFHNQINMFFFTKLSITWFARTILCANASIISLLVIISVIYFSIYELWINKVKINELFI
jgi:hypothetical protein